MKIKSSILYFILVVFLNVYILLSSSAQNNTQAIKDYTRPNTGFLDFNTYYDTRNFSVLTINILAKLPRRIQYFSLTNYQGPVNSSDLSTLYAEHNLRWGIKKKLPLELTYQYVLRGGERNDDHRLGIRWILSSTPGLDSLLKKAHVFYSINPMPIEYREGTGTKFMTIIEHVYNIKIMPVKLNNRVYIGGFADQNFVYNSNGTITFKWVSEHQLGIRLIDQFFAVFEYRINTFLPYDNYGLGYGLEYNIRFK